MSYNPNTGIVQDTGANDGVSIRDVQRALGVSSSDLYTLCKHSNVKVLSKKKPIRGRLGAFLNSADTPQELSDTGFMQRNMGFSIPTFQGNDFLAAIKGIVEGNYGWDTYTQGGSDGGQFIGNGWVYRILRQNTDFARLTDFNGYEGRQLEGYENDTFVVMEDARVIQGKNTAVAPKFWTAMNPFHPRNFYSLSDQYGGQYRLGVAFYAPDWSGSQVYYYVGSNISYDSLLWAYSQESENSYLLMSNDMFKRYLNKLGSTATTIYAVGFFAPKTYSGYNNINASGTHEPKDMSNLHPLPGNGFCTMILQTSSGRTICMLDFACTTNVMRPTETSFSIRFTKITNNYDDTQQTIVYYNRLMVSYIIFGANGIAKYDKKNDLSAAATSGTIDVTNTGTSGNIVHTSVNVDLTKTFTGISREYIEDGGYIRVFIWYMTGNSTWEQPDYYQTNEYVISIGDRQQL